MTVFLNGEAAECADDTTIEQLLSQRGLAPEATLVEHNGTALPRREWGGKRLASSDRLEILRVAAGG
ncbi:MAG: sulfur carrier protein ThiS [Verrucomicrobiota bacterium]|nr:sulfur carrier protein ThiS [Verrucomicrobiota bacterium]